MARQRSKEFMAPVKGAERQKPSGKKSNAKLTKDVASTNAGKKRK